MDQLNFQAERQARRTQENPRQLNEGRGVCQKSAFSSGEETGWDKQRKDELRGREQNFEWEAGSPESRDREWEAGDKREGDSTQGGELEAAEEQREDADEPEEAGEAEERVNKGLQEAGSVHLSSEEDEHPPSNCQQPRF